MNSYPESLQPLADVIERLIAQTSLLLDLLEDEREALLARDPDQLNGIVQRKGDAARALGELEARLHALAGPGGIPPAFELRLAQVPNGGTSLAARWLELGRLARHASDANRDNGALLDARERQVRGALSALNPDPAPTYGRGGYGQVQFGGRVHGFA